MQSFQDFISSRRKKSGDVDQLQQLRRSRSEHATNPVTEGSQLQRSPSRTSPGNLANSPLQPGTTETASISNTAAEAAAVHTTTTVSGGTAPATAGSRYLSRSSTAAGSRHKHSHGVSAALQQLISPQRSAALISESNSFRVGTATAAAVAAAGGVGGAAGTYAAAAAAPGAAELIAVASSRSAGKLSSHGQSRLQPLSVADALQSPLSRSTAVPPSAARTPTGALTPTGGRRYPAATSAGGDAAAAVAGSWSEERSATSVLQEAASRAAALHRSTTIKSQASQVDSVHSGLPDPNLGQHVLMPQHSQQQHKQWAAGQQQQPQLLQQQQFGQQKFLPQQQRHGLQHMAAVQSVQQQQQQEEQQCANAAALLHDLDRRFASIKDSLRGVFSPQDSMQYRHTAASDLGAAASAAAAAADCAVAESLPGRTQYQHAMMTEPYSLDDESSGGICQCSPMPLPQVQPAGQTAGSPQRQQQQKQQLLSPADSSSCDDSSDDNHSGGAPRWRRQQQQQQQHESHSPVQHDKYGRNTAADVTLNGVAPSGRKQGMPAALAAATTATAADGSLPVEVEVKYGEEGQLQGATAHFRMSHVLSPDAAGSRQAQQLGKRQQLAREPSLPSTCDLLTAEHSDVAFQILSPSGTAPHSQHSSADFLTAHAPRPRSNKPKPSIAQRHQQGHKVADAAGSVAPGGAAAAVASAGSGMLESEGDRWCSNALILAKHQAKELQHQNDALVRVLERERQQHTKTRQQVSESKLDFQTAQAEWEVKLQALRQDKATAEAQLRRALAGSEQQEVLAAYDAALAASAARAEEAQAAAARLATQTTELELQVQQLQLICNTSTAAADGGGTAPASRRPLNGSMRADAAATLRAVASAECRSPDKRPPCRNAFNSGAAPDGCGGRGVRALRQHQTHLEQQLGKVSEELSQLQRANIKLLRYKTQYEVATQSLQSSAGAKAAAEAYAQEAGLRAAAAAGRADKLEMEVEELQKQLHWLTADRDRMQLHLQVSQQQQQQQQRLQASLSTSGSYTLPGAGQEQYSAAGYQSTAVLAGTGASNAWGAPVNSASSVATAAGAAGTAGGEQDCFPRESSGKAAAPDGSQFSLQRQQQDAPFASQSKAASAAAAEVPSGDGGVVGRKLWTSLLGSGSGAASRVAVQPVSAAEQDALCVVQQLRTSLPDASPVQGQLASLMNAIQAGVQERQALAAQGKVLLDMLVGGS